MGRYINISMRLPLFCFPTTFGRIILQTKAPTIIINLNKQYKLHHPRNNHFYDVYVVLNSINSAEYCFNILKMYISKQGFHPKKGWIWMNANRICNKCFGKTSKCLMVIMKMIGALVHILNTHPEFPAIKEFGYVPFLTKTSLSVTQRDQPGKVNPSLLKVSISYL